MTVQLKKGDVFSIPVSESIFGMGQVVDVLPQELYLIVFDRTWKENETTAVNELNGCEPFLASLSLDAKLWNGDWKVIGNYQENLGNIAIPLFKVRIGGDVFVESYDGGYRRMASTSETELLRNRKTVAPVRLEKALKAKLGIGDWHPAYDELTYDYAVSSSALKT